MAQTFNKRESLFGGEATEYDALSKIVKDFEPYASLWQTANDWAGWQREWLDGPIVKLDPDEVDKAFTNAQRNVAKLVKSFKDLPGCLGIAKQVKDEMGGFAQNVPVVQALRNPGMRDRHWDDLSKELRFELRPDDKFTLRDATEGLRLHEKATLEKVQKVTDRAMKEFAIEKTLNDMVAAWDDQDFEVMPYRNTPRTPTPKPQLSPSPYPYPSPGDALPQHGHWRHQANRRGQLPPRRPHCTHAAVLLLALQGALRGAHRRLGA